MKRPAAAFGKGTPWKNADIYDWIVNPGGRRLAPRLHKSHMLRGSNLTSGMAMASLNKRLFNTGHDNGRCAQARPAIGQEAVNRALAERLQDKIRNYHREAAKLEIRGQSDAALALREAAGQLKSIIRTKPNVAEGAC